jgi:hypothetical protein
MYAVDIFYYLTVSYFTPLGWPGRLRSSLPSFQCVGELRLDGRKHMEPSTLVSHDHLVPLHLPQLPRMPSFGHF